MHRKKFEIVSLTILSLVFGISSAFSYYRHNAGAASIFNAATWNVAITPGNNTSFRIMPDVGTAQYNFDVISNSEVEVKYAITVNNIPSGVEVKLDQGTFQGGNSTITFTNAGIFLYGESNTNSHILTFRATTGAAIVNNQSISVSVTFEQIV